MGWFAAALPALAPVLGGALGGLLGGGKKNFPDMSTLSKAERAAIMRAATDYFSGILEKNHLFTPGQLNSMLSPGRAMSTSNWLSAVRGATEGAMGSGQGSRSGTLADSLDEAFRTRTAADRSGANRIAQLEATLLPSMQMDSAGQLGQMAQRDASLAQGTAAANAQMPSRLEAALAGGLGGLGQVDWGAFGGGSSSNSILPGGSAQWDPAGGGFNPQHALPYTPNIRQGPYNPPPGPRIELPDGKRWRRGL